VQGGGGVLNSVIEAATSSLPLFFFLLKPPRCGGGERGFESLFSPPFPPFCFYDERVLLFPFSSMTLPHLTVIARLPEMGLGTSPLPFFLSWGPRLKKVDRRRRHRVFPPSSFFFLATPGGERRASHGRSPLGTTTFSPGFSFFPSRSTLSGSKPLGFFLFPFSLSRRGAPPRTLKRQPSAGLCPVLFLFLSLL